MNRRRTIIISSNNQIIKEMQIRRHQRCTVRWQGWCMCPLWRRLFRILGHLLEDLRGGHLHHPTPNPILLTHLIECSRNLLPNSTGETILSWRNDECTIAISWVSNEDILADLSPFPLFQVFYNNTLPVTLHFFSNGVNPLEKLNSNLMAGLAQFWLHLDYLVSKIWSALGLVLVLPRFDFI